MERSANEQDDIGNIQQGDSAVPVLQATSNQSVRTVGSNTRRTDVATTASNTTAARGRNTAVRGRNAAARGRNAAAGANNAHGGVPGRHGIHRRRNRVDGAHSLYGGYMISRRNRFLRCCQRLRQLYDFLNSGLRTQRLVTHVRRMHRSLIRQVINNEFDDFADLAMLATLVSDGGSWPRVRMGAMLLNERHRRHYIQRGLMPRIRNRIRLAQPTSRATMQQNVVADNENNQIPNPDEEQRDA